MSIPYVILTIILMGVIGGVILWFLDHRGVLKLFDAASAQMSKGTSAVWGRDPKALMEKAIRDTEAEVGEITPALGSQQGLIARLKRQVDEEQIEAAKLDRRIERKLTEGKDEEAAKLQVQLEALKQSMEENKSRYEEKSQNQYKQSRRHLHPEIFVKTSKHRITHCEQVP